MPTTSTPPTTSIITTEPNLLETRRHKIISWRNRWSQGVQTRRNFWAYAALWLVVLSWIGLGVRILVGEIGSFDGPLDWIYIAVIGLAIVTGGAAIAAIRTRGEASLAITTFVLSLILPALYALFFGLVWALFGGEGGLD